jgi:hypothetical protein
MLKTYVARAAPIHLFVKQYSRLVADRLEDEGREEHATKQVRTAKCFILSWLKNGFLKNNFLGRRSVSAVRGVYLTKVN